MRRYYMFVAYLWLDSLKFVRKKYVVCCFIVKVSFRFRSFDESEWEVSRRRLFYERYIIHDTFTLLTRATKNRKGARAGEFPNFIIWVNPEVTQSVNNSFVSFIYFCPQTQRSLIDHLLNIKWHCITNAAPTTFY